MIGVVTTSYPRWPGDPAGNFVAAHVAALRAMGERVDVLAAGHGPDRIPSSLFYDGGAPDKLEHGGLLAALAFTARLTAAVAMRRWDSIIAHWLAPSALAALPSRTPLLAIAHGGDIHTLRRMRLLAPALHLLHARGARLAFVSEELRQIARAAAPRLARWLDDALVQAMGIDVARFARLARVPSDPPIVLVAARLVRLKGVDVALAAMAHVTCCARLVIAGDGPERAQLVARARDGVRFLGAVDTTTRDQLLERASAVVIPSRSIAGRSEGTPLIALEALAAGVPVIGSSVGGLAALPIEHVAPDEPRALAGAIDRILAAPPAARDLRARVAHLDWQTVARRLSGENGATPSRHRSA